MVNQQKIYNSMPSNLSNFLLQPISQSQKNNLNLISKCEYNFLENEQTASARKRIHDQVVKVSCNDEDAGTQGASDNKKARYDNTHSAYPESTGLAAEALPVCSPDNQEQSETSAIVLGKVTISPKDVQYIIESNKKGFPSHVIAHILDCSEETVDQIICEQDNNEMKEPINPDKEFLVKVMKKVNRRSLRSIVEDINKKISCEEINKKSKLGMNTLCAIKGWFYQKEICTMYHENEEKAEDIAEKFDISENHVHRITAMVYRNNESREDCIKIRRTVISKKIVKTLEEDIKNGMCVNAIARKNRLHSSVIKKVKLEYLKPKIYAMIKNTEMPLVKIAEKYGLCSDEISKIKKECYRENALELNKTMAQKAIEDSNVNPVVSEIAPENTTNDELLNTIKPGQFNLSSEQFEEILKTI
ncbi:MAG: hypothetical protein OXD32_08720 [Endozoicomonadaceae bacterium]|nr:hypothetical protein [Endozoicomonadaceae bacterium]